MAVYILNLLLILAYAFIFKTIHEFARESGTNNKISNSILLLERRGIIGLICLQFFVISAFKDLSVGADMVRYERGFKEIGALSWNGLSSYGWEYGYVLLNKAVQVLTSDFRAIIVIVSLVIIGLLGIYVYNESNSPWLSMYLFVTMGFFDFSLSGYRQSLALLITMFSIRYVKKRQLLKFIALVLLASLFHQSALVFLIVYPISYIKIDKTYLFAVLSVGVFIFLFGGKIISIVLSFYHRQQIVVSGQGLGMFAMLLAITVMGLIFFKSAKLDDPDNSLYCHLLIIATLSQVFSFHLSIFVRLVSYFSIHMIVFIPNILSSVPSKILKILGTLGIIGITFLYYLFIMLGNSSGTVPYTFMW